MKILAQFLTIEAFDAPLDRALAEVADREAERYSRWANCAELAEAHRELARLLRARAEVRERAP